MRPRNINKLITGAILALVFGFLWFYLAPVGVGGSTSWVVTDGISMEPRFHAGDLVMVRSQSDYKVGEIVAYNSKVFHTVVLHRIIGRAGSRYIFKGDNNNFIDFEHPARSQLIGALWLHLPGVGADLESIHSPLLIGGLFALATLLFAGAAFTHHQRRRRRRRRAAGPGHVTPGAPRGPQAPQLMLVACGLVAMLPFASLAVLAFTRPAESLLQSEAPYEQHGTLSYSAQARPGLVYPGDTAHTGDPLFTHVINRVDVRFSYHFESREAHRVGGKIALAATLRSSAGWRRTVPLGSAVAFRGDRGFAAATVELDKLLALVRTVETSTGVRSTYTVTVTPQVTTKGTLGGLALHAAFAPAIGFTLNPLELQPIASGAASRPGGTVPAGAFTRTATGSASGRRPQPLHVSLGFVELPVSTARAISLIGLALVGLLFGALIFLARPRRRDESAAIRARYGGLIIPVERVWQLPGVSVIDVADIEALVRIAAHYDRSILHELTDYGEAFWVTDESGQFRYWIGPTEGLAAVTNLPAEPASQPVSPVAVHSPAVADWDTAPTLEFSLGQGVGQARGATAWTGGESVQHIEAPAGSENGAHPN